MKSTLHCYIVYDLLINIIYNMKFISRLLQKLLHLLYTRIVGSGFR